MVPGIVAELENAPFCRASMTGSVPDAPGFYQIFVDDRENLPGLAPYLRNTKLIYVGIASKSLLKRLVEQDLQHKKASTFFRGIGAVLEYRPEAGSLKGMKNQNNYKFSAADTGRIKAWMHLHLIVRFVVVAKPNRENERELIRYHRPVLNATHNPERLAYVAELRSECRKIACGRE